MNLLTDPNLWTDFDGNSPPAYWNPEDERYEMLLSDPGAGNAHFRMFGYVPADGDILEADVAIANFVPQIGQIGYLKVFVNGIDRFSALLEDLPFDFHLYVDELEEGDYLQILITASYDDYTASGFYDFEATITPTDTPVPPSGNYYVYEMEKGWSFDGNYIPHFLELNWYFGEAPVNYHGIQKVRIHGLAKGWAKLQVAMAGMQTDYDSDYMQPQWIDLGEVAPMVKAEFRPVTNYTDYSVRGLSVQMLFSGRNEDLTKPEPSHVIQVLVTQSTPLDSGFRGN